MSRPEASAIAPPEASCVRRSVASRDMNALGLIQTTVSQQELHPRKSGQHTWFSVHIRNHASIELTGLCNLTRSPVGGCNSTGSNALVERVRNTVASRKKERRPKSQQSHAPAYRPSRDATAPSEALSGRNTPASNPALELGGQVRTQAPSATRPDP